MDKETVAGVIRERMTDISRSLDIPYEGDRYYLRLESERDALEDLAQSLSLLLPESIRREWLATVKGSA
jgi:hypothetical protein